MHTPDQLQEIIVSQLPTPIRMGIHAGWEFLRWCLSPDQPLEGMRTFGSTLNLAMTMPQALLTLSNTPRIVRALEDRIREVPDITRDELVEWLRTQATHDPQVCVDVYRALVAKGRDNYSMPLPDELPLQLSEEASLAGNKFLVAFLEAVTSAVEAAQRARESAGDAS